MWPRDLNPRLRLLSSRAKTATLPAMTVAAASPAKRLNDLPVRILMLVSMSVRPAGGIDASMSSKNA